MSKKIAFLFLVIDNPHFPKVWDKYFENHEHQISVYIHPKFPDEHTWKPDRIIENLQPTGWGFIVGAYMELFKVAIQDPLNVKFVTISESCVPIKPFDEFYDFVITNNTNKSLIRMMKISNYDYAERLSDEIKKKYNRRLIKHYARMCLSIGHVKQLIGKSADVEEFAKMHVGDEFFLSSISPIDKSTYIDFAVCHDDWVYIDRLKKSIKNEIRVLYEEQEANTSIDNSEKILELKARFSDIAKNPKKIVKLDKEDLHNMTHTQSFFYRKFDLKSNVEKYVYKMI